MEKKFKTVVLGGTFDHIHKGHKEFIKFALSLSAKVIIGLTSDKYVENSKAINLETYEIRKKEVEDFLEQEKLRERVTLIEIEDIYGPTISEKYNIDALVVVEKTLDGAKAVNDKRKALGFVPLEIIIAPSIEGEDGRVISSSRIRNGEIDRDGKLFINPKWLEKTIYLPDNLREELKNPFGELIADDNFRNINEPAITVGDITTQKFNKLSLNQKISVIDLNVSRKKMFEDIYELGFLGNEKVVKVKNPAGQISPELFKVIIASFLDEGRVVIEIIGEDDLAVLPIILAAPLGVTVFYGQPEQGLVRIEVSENLKQKVYILLTEFTQSSQ